MLNKNKIINEINEIIEESRIDEFTDINFAVSLVKLKIEEIIKEDIDNIDVVHTYINSLEECNYKKQILLEILSRYMADSEF